MTEPLSILSQDDSLLVLEKPAGLPSVSLKDDEAGTLASLILARFPEQALLPRGALEAGLAHRLDNETSGIVVAGRTAEALAGLRLQFEQGTVEKEYRALVIGTPPERGSIELPIAHHPRKKARMVVCDSPARAVEWKGRPAVTRYSTLARYGFIEKERDTVSAHYALLSVAIDTGVRHQIRVHLAHLGHPLAGDKLYRNPGKRAADPLPLERHFLHCSRLSFRHPVTGETVSFESPLPDDLQQALSTLQECPSMLNIGSMK